MAKNALFLLKNYKNRPALDYAVSGGWALYFRIPSLQRIGPSSPDPNGIRRPQTPSIPPHCILL